jgi:hypothetical protein
MPRLPQIASSGAGDDIFDATALAVASCNRFALALGRPTTLSEAGKDPLTIPISSLLFIGIKYRN